MIIVSLLLCLTLISSCFVSSIYAKFTKTATADGSATVQKFGAGITIDVDTAQKTKLESLGATVTVTKVDNKGISVTIENLKMGPEDAVKDAIHVTLSGVANVDCELRIKAEVSYETAENKQPNSFYIPNGNGVTGNTSYMPIKLWCLADKDGDSDTALNEINLRTPQKGQSTTAVVNTVHRIFWQHFDVVGSPDPVDYNKDVDYVVKTFEPTDKIALHPKPTKGYNGAVDSNVDIDEFWLGFEWPFDTNADTSAMETYLAQNADPTVTIKYTISIEQT